MFCSEVTFEVTHTVGVAFEVNCIKARVAIRCSKLTDCLLPFAAGSGGRGMERLAANLPKGGFQAWESLPGAGFTAQSQHGRRDGRGNLTEE